MTRKAKGIEQREQALQAMIDFHSETSYWPSVRELAERLGLTPDAAHKRLKHLLNNRQIIKFAPRAYILPTQESNH